MSQIKRNGSTKTYYVDPWAGTDSDSNPGNGVGTNQWKTLKYAISRLPYNAGGTAYTIIIGNSTRTGDTFKTYTITEPIICSNRYITVVLDYVNLTFGPDANIEASNPQTTITFKGTQNGTDIATITFNKTGTGSTLSFDRGAIHVFNRARVTFDSVIIKATNLTNCFVRSGTWAMVYFNAECTLTASISGATLMNAYTGAKILVSISSSNANNCKCTVTDARLISCTNGARVYLHYASGTVVSGQYLGNAETGGIIQIGAHTVVVKGTSTEAPCRGVNGGRVYIGTQTSVPKY